jgi:prevent-host-death family protein
MREVQATEAKAHLAEVLRAVERGESIAITRRGRTIAHIVPAGSVGEPSRSAAIDRFLDRRARWEKAGKMSTEEILAARHGGHRACEP